MTYFLLFSFAHVIADFLLQPTQLVEQKKEKSTRIKALAIHVGIHLLLYVLLLLPWFIWENPSDMSSVLVYIGVILSVTVIHFIIDYFKEVSSEKATSQKQHAFIFAVDQLLHVISIVMVLRMFQVVNFTFTELAGDIYDYLFHGIL